MAQISLQELQAMSPAQRAAKLRELNATSKDYEEIQSALQRSDAASGRGGGPTSAMSTVLGLQEALAGPGPSESGPPKSIGDRLSTGIAKMNTLGHKLQTPDPESSGLTNLVRSLGGGGAEIMAGIGQGTQDLGNWVFGASGDTGRPTAGADNSGEQMQAIIDMFSGGGGQEGPQQLLNMGKLDVDAPPAQPGVAGTDLSDYFSALNNATPKGPSADDLKKIKKNTMLSGIAGGLAAVANGRDMTTGQGLAAMAANMLGAKASGEAATEERLAQYDQAMQKHNLLLAQGKLTEARIAKADADREIEIGYANQMRQWEHDLKVQEANRPKLLQSSDSTMVVEETDPASGERMINRYSYAHSRNASQSAGALGGRLGKPGKLAEAAQVRTPVGKIGFVIDTFMGTVGDAGLGSLFGEDRLEALNEMAAERAMQVSAQITDAKQRDQIFRDTRAQILWEQATKSPELAVAMIQYMNGIN